LKRMPRDSAAIQVASAVTLAISPRPKGVLAISAALKPCSVSMQVTRRDSRSCTLPVSLKVARQLDEGALDHARALAQVALLERGVLGPAFLLPQLFALGLEQLGRVAVLSILRYSAMPSAASSAPGPRAALPAPRQRRPGARGDFFMGVVSCFGSSGAVAAAALP
jgi:hypothetical protein